MSHNPRQSRGAERKAKRAARTSGNEERHRFTRLRLSAGLGMRRNYSANTSRMTSGRLAAMVSKAWAAPDGLRRPCSHS